MVHWRMIIPIIPRAASTEPTQTFHSDVLKSVVVTI